MLLAVAIVAGARIEPARAQPHPLPAVEIPELTPWLDKNGEPIEAAGRHGAHFSIPYQIDPGHKVPAPVSTRTDVGYGSDALWLRFEAEDPHPSDIGLR